MSITFDILKEMYNKELNYKGYRCNIFGIPKLSVYEKRALSLALNRLIRLAYVITEGEQWKLTEKGKQYYIQKRNSFKQFDSLVGNTKQRLILIFDIPEPRKAERDWLRAQLKNQNFKLIQKSVWVGPSPLHKDFVKYLKEIKLTNCIKTFKLSRS
jgi:DNA-binding transcriptional regulator PaaX